MGHGVTKAKPDFADVEWLVRVEVPALLKHRPSLFACERCDLPLLLASRGGIVRIGRVGIIHVQQRVEPHHAVPEASKELVLGLRAVRRRGLDGLGRVSLRTLMLENE